MSYNNASGSTLLTRIICAIVFLTFTFLFVYSYQAPTLMYLQHVLSDGQTYYDPLVGGIIITILVQTVQTVVYRFHRLSDASYSLTYLPSMIFLALLVNVNPQEEGGIAMGTFCYFLPLLIIAYFFLVTLSRQWIRIPQKGGGLLSSIEMLLNLVIMILTMWGVSAFACSDRTFFARMNAEQAFKNHDNAAILAQCAEANICDTTLTYYRLQALEHNKTIGDSLFHTPVAGSTASLYHLTGVHRYLISNRQMLLQRHTADYRLASLLLDRNIDAFAQQLQKSYTINDSLPQHYKEALLLYQHLRSKPLTNYVDTVMETDYDGLQDIIRKCSNATQRSQQLRRTYPHTYWEYFFDKVSSID